ncbi:OmpA family protein [Sphingomonas sp. C3-2]|uniref:OmpA family protein n=1 Tax=Sphingomonas sp. C3-2 TaxID=3062169 RepID=UPI00294B1C12|nr:OmpA family protein [Sphingomonas sp. C3-2]WOK35935.1 OmpA family protein [Sphingomonas sp. C3-2]
MRSASLIVGLVIVAACSNEQSAPPAPEHGNDISTAPAAPVAPAQRDNNGPVLTGKVSTLTSKVSGLAIRVTDMGTIVDLPADALFQFDKAELTSSATEQLLKVAELIRGAPEGTIRVIGHTDSKGDAVYNQKLSVARAERVAQWFKEQVGVRQRSFETEGQGENAPIAPNMTPDGKDDPDGRAKNRRVEVVIPKG